MIFAIFNQFRVFFDRSEPTLASTPTDVATNDNSDTIRDGLMAISGEC